MARDLLAGFAWNCCVTEPGAAERPSDLGVASATWMLAELPGTAASAIRASGHDLGQFEDVEAFDWWWTVQVPDEAVGPMQVVVGGLATIADVYLNDVELFHSENMFRGREIDVDLRGGLDHLAICCRALAPRLAQRRPRPRWRTDLVNEQNLRHYRTSLIGRTSFWPATPPIVGPWRGVELHDANVLRLTSHHLTTRLEGSTGVLDVTVEFNGPAVDRPHASMGNGEVGLAQDPHAERRWHGEIRIEACERWWPHTHGSATLYPVDVRVGDAHFELPPVGFRTVDINRNDEGFDVSVNGERVFCRGAVWTPTDLIEASDDDGTDASLAALLGLARQANLNIVRVPGTAVYETPDFYDLCDRLGILVWQDLMFANMDPPEDDTFVDDVVAEVTEVVTALAGRPSVIVISGGSEIEQQAAMQGLAPEQITLPLFTKTLADLAKTLAPGTTFVTSSPTGGTLPFRSDRGIAHYFGVGAYRRPLEDVATAGVRFAAECLAFATPPEQATVEAAFGNSRLAGHDPRWKSAVPRDRGTSWDFEDVTTSYVRRLFGVDLDDVRARDADLALDYARGAVTECMQRTLIEWRRPASHCAGAIVLSFADTTAGAGWGLVDALGEPKAPWYALRRVLSPIAVAIRDEGLNGLRVLVFNDSSTALHATLELDLVHQSSRVEHCEHGLVVPAREYASFDAELLLGSFRDIGYSYRFGPPQYDAVVATVRDPDGEELSQFVHLPLGLGRPREYDVGLGATVGEIGPGIWDLEVSTEHLAEFTCLDVAGYRLGDNWFHLAPGATKHVTLTAKDPSESLPPSGRVRAINAVASSIIRRGN